MDIELTPLQAPEIEAAVAASLAAPPEAVPDPWWQAGLDESLET